MKAQRLLLLTILWCTLSFPSLSQTVIGRQNVDQFPCTPWGTIAYGLTWLPTDYSTNTTQRYPLIIFLHGVGETGNGVSGLNTLLNTALPQTIANGWDPEAVNPVDGQNYKFIVVSPQAPTASSWSFQWNNLQWILKDILFRYRVDSSRIYITGLSAGGNGTWTCVTSGPDAKKFAAVVPIASAPVALDSIPKLGSEYGVKLWQICGDQDAFYPFSVNSTTSYNSGLPAPNPPATLTTFPGQGHWVSVWNTAYDPTWTNNVHNKNIYQWMLQFKRTFTTTSLTANAGPNQNITLPTNTVTLNGSGTAPAGETISTYSWTKISGPSGDVILSPSSASTLVSFSGQGVYQYQLKLTSNVGDTAVASVQVTVNAATLSNVIPVANAGSDISITLPLDSVTLSGNGTDADGTITSVLWTKISGPSQFSITNPASSQTVVDSLVAGTYQFKLEVMDDSGAIDSDTIQVLVNAAVISGCGGTKKYMIPDGSHGKFISGDTSSWWHMEVNPGDTLVLRSQDSWSFFRMEKFSGTAACPIVVINEGGQVWMTSGINAESCRYMKITGSGAPNVFYGFRVYNPGEDGPGVAIGILGRSSNIEVERFDVKNKGYGVWAKQDPTCDPDYNYPNFIMDSIEIHHSRFKRIGQDCIYAGNTDPLGERPTWCNNVETHPIPMRLSNINIHHLIIDSCNRTGIQLGGAETGFNQIHDNIVTNCGYEYNQEQGAGISIGGMTRNCHVYNNVVKNTFLFGIFDLGADSSFVYNNVIDSSGWLKIDPSVDVNALAAHLGITAVGQWLKNTPLGGVSSIQATTKPTLPHHTKTVFYKNNKVGINTSPYADGVISFSQWGPAEDWTNLNKVCNNTKLDGITAATINPYWYIDSNKYWPVIDTGCNMSFLNVSPVAFAGNDSSITSPADSITLHGSGTDADGFITSYHWTKVSGPSSFLITEPDSALTLIKNLVPGIYTFRLTVTDNSGASSTDDIQISLDPPNHAPIAHAGPFKIIVVPASTTTLEGNAIDPDDVVLTYNWTKISGPSSYTFADSTQMQTSLTNLVAGSYKFVLTVTDGHGAFDKDTMMVDVDIAPVANAGPDQTIMLPVNSVMLNGTASDADGSLAGFTWSRISGPSSYNISSPAQLQTNVTGLGQGVYEFELKVTDNFGIAARDTVMITVLMGPNVPPVANAGLDTTITLPVNSVTLTGNGTDSDGTIVSYGWTMISGPTLYTINSPAQAQTVISNLVAGVYQFQLTVTDDSNAVATDIVTVIVNPANQPPTAFAGQDITIYSPVDSTTLYGTGTDVDGTITSYQWSKISGPVFFVLNNASQAQALLTGLSQAVYHFRLRVTDNGGAVGYDTVQVTVLPAPNIPPVANAGADHTITLPVDSVVLNGSGTDSDGVVSSYVWTYVSGPASYIISSASTAQTVISGLMPGVYVFQLAVTDNSGTTTTDLVTITVNAAPPPPNVNPVSNAGSDITITLPTNSVNLAGSGTDADGIIISYQWKNISGPSSFVIVSATQSQTQVNQLLEGVYQFELEVMDNSGASGKDTVVVTVLAAVNLPPVANAGADQSVGFSTNSTQLSGSGTDPDGVVVSYLWKKINASPSVNILNSGSAQTMVTGLIHGNSYQFELTVTDDKGATDTDTMTVTVAAAPVNIPPVAHAGNNELIYWPTDSVKVMGSGTDVDGTVTNYLWTKISGPSQYTIVTPTQPTTIFKDLVEGEYEFELTVTDNGGDSGKDTVKIIVVNYARLNTQTIIFPNPVTTEINVRIVAATQKSKSSIVIYDTRGAVLYREQLNRTDFIMDRKIDVSKLAPGCYWIVVGVDINSTRTFSFVK